MIYQYRFFDGQMNLTELKQVCLYGRVHDARAEYMPTMRGWVVSLRYSTRDGEQQDTLGSQREAVRAFKTLDALVAALRSAGITLITIDSTGR